MNETAWINDEWILSCRGSKNPVDPLKPYGWLVEKELSSSGRCEDTGIIFLTNRECPFHCLMCDLWKNTTDFNSEEGAIPAQIEFALKKMPSARHLKLYNSGSFFDTRAIPAKDHVKIASLVRDFSTVIVESHPSFIGDASIRFRDSIHTRLEIAIGLESIHADVMRLLNKRMTLTQFSKSVSFLLSNNISVRAFILLKPPLLGEEEGIEWACRSMDFAFETGVECCTIIPVRSGNGAMNKLEELSLFSRPSIQSLEKVLEYGLQLKKGRVFADTWDLHYFSVCPHCEDMRQKRITEMNLSQSVADTINCLYCKA